MSIGRVWGVPVFNECLGRELSNGTKRMPNECPMPPGLIPPGLLPPGLLPPGLGPPGLIPHGPAVERVGQNSFTIIEESQSEVSQVL